MTILNYFFIGAVFTFILDLILYRLQNHPIMLPVLEQWDNKTRIACVLVWPLALIVFIFSFIKSGIK
tara:strand:+ start:667 stop:867 length:201 start_codon:yes stop_codon:yes gene_type:complete